LQVGVPVALNVTVPVGGALELLLVAELFDVLAVDIDFENVDPELDDVALPTLEAPCCEAPATLGCTADLAVDTSAALIGAFARDWLAPEVAETTGFEFGTPADGFAGSVLLLVTLVAGFKKPGFGSTGLTRPPIVAPWIGLGSFEAPTGVVAPLSRSAGA
jgi:hypothetical protein